MLYSQFGRYLGEFACCRDNYGNKIIFITDGVSHDPVKTKEEARYLADMGVEIIVVGFGKYNVTELQVR